MSVYKKQSIVKQFPAFDVVRREKGNFNAINITANETITDSNMLGGWYLNSVVSYALSNNECPIQSIQEANERKEPLQWINPHAICISSSPEKMAPHILIEDDDIINFEGRLYTVVAVSKQEKALVPYVPS